MHSENLARKLRLFLQMKDYEHLIKMGSPPTEYDIEADFIANYMLECTPDEIMEYWERGFVNGQSEAPFMKAHRREISKEIRMFLNLNMVVNSADCGARS